LLQLVARIDEDSPDVAGEQALDEGVSRRNLCRL
jgi:hypothetical protein